MSQHSNVPFSHSLLLIRTFSLITNLLSERKLKVISSRKVPVSIWTWPEKHLWNFFYSNHRKKRGKMESFETRKFLFVLFLLLKVCEAKTVSCEDFGDFDFGQPIEAVKTCWMEPTTAIDEPGTMISTRDGTVRGLNLSNNKKIFYLPDNVTETFPNLEGYEAWECSVKEISKQNFQGLTKLKVLSLQNN